MTDAIQKGLLPCPFCGGAAMLEMAIPCHSGAWVQCVECDARSCSFKGKDADDSDAIAIAAWNRRAALAATPADVGEEPVAWVMREKASDGHWMKWHVVAEDTAISFASRNSTDFDVQKVYSATALERVTRERDEALRWAGCWHRICQTIATVLELPEPEGDTFAASVRDKLSVAEAKLAEARKVISGLLACPAISDGNHSEPAWADHETIEAERAARRFLEETKS